LCNIGGEQIEIGAVIALAGTAWVPFCGALGARTISTVASLPKLTPPASKTLLVFWTRPQMSFAPGAKNDMGRCLAAS